MTRFRPTSRTATNLENCRLPKGEPFLLPTADYRLPTRRLPFRRPKADLSAVAIGEGGRPRYFVLIVTAVRGGLTYADTTLS